MLDTSFTNGISRWFKQFLNKEPTIIGPVRTAQCCLSFANKKILLLRLDHGADKPEILALESTDYQDVDEIPTLLYALAKRNNLHSLVTHWLLQPNEYEVFLIESLPVQEEEFKEALKWRIKTLLDYPIEEALLDSFKIPSKKGSASNYMIAAITAKHKQLKKTIDEMRKTEFKLEYINIPELSLKTLTQYYENDERSTAFVFFYENVAILNITRQKTLYFTRQMEITVVDEFSAGEHERICLEILRYFDYYQSQWRYQPPSRMFIATENKDTGALAQGLANFLQFSVEAFDIAPFVINKTSQAKIPDAFLLLIGAILSGEEKYVTPGS